MNVFIVHAHPEPQSFCTALCNTAAAHLQTIGHEIRISDLYEMGFNPVASAAEFRQRKNADYLVYALKQRHGYESGSLRRHPGRDRQAALVRSDDPELSAVLVLDAAIPKGWIDRVLISGLTSGGMRFYDRGGLAHKRAMTTFTLGGAPGGGARGRTGRQALSICPVRASEIPRAQRHLSFTRLRNVSAGQQGNDSRRQLLRRS